MEFPDLGEHCVLSTCKQLDFLPLKCDACSRTYCKDHVSYENHNCEPGLKKDRKVPVCPLCNQPVSLSASENADQKVNEHIENHCKSDLAKHQRSGKCGVKGCKKRELIPVFCATCKRKYCLRHRHEADHECTGNTNSNNRSNQSSASKQAGLAATSRYQPTPSSKSYTNTQSNKRNPQQSHLSSIGANLNRERNQRQQIPSRNQAASLQAQNLTEDEALALALQASLTTSSTTTQPPQQQPPKPSTNTEDADASLARAIAESEKEERERQRRKNQQSTDKDKDSCTLS